MISKDKYTDPYHHYLSQFYLRKFCNTGKLTILDVKNGFIAQKPTKRICGEYGFFTLDGVSGFLKEKNVTEFYYKGIQLKPNLLEEEFSKLEVKAAPCFEKIVKNESLGNVTHEEFSDFIEWLTWICVANPQNKQLLKNKDLEASNTSLCGGFISLHKKILPFFRGRSWRLAHTDQVLLTNDRPVCSIPKTPAVNDFYALSKACIIFPMTRNLLLMGDANIERQLKVYRVTDKLKSDRAFEANLALCHNASQHLIASSRQDLDDWFKKYYAIDIIKTLKNRLRKLSE